ncbi:hypothetical protein [Dasania marina]|uniref:hypothetical protein n=1 Tax=Dasania marina TaxID=471499 RepID=UPI0030D950F6|tara:strand:- start:728 stop:1561 length:834 start_codon:yes stop_codon:yes gene_type:complete
MNILKTEKTLSNLNELSTALILLILGFSVFSSSLLPGPDKVEVSIEEPVYEEKVIGMIPAQPFSNTFRLDEVLMKEVIVSSPTIVNNKLMLSSIRKTFSGEGVATVRIVRKEVLIPKMANVPYIELNSGVIPNINMIGSGLYYDDKEVVFDGVNQPHNIKYILEKFLGGCAIILLLFRFFLWLSSPNRRRKEDQKVVDDSPENNTLLAYCLGHRSYLAKQDVIISESSTGHGVCNECLLRFLEEREADNFTQHEGIVDAINRWHNESSDTEVARKEP